jgi:membrane protease YdiL (CAAX protease family)
MSWMLIGLAFGLVLTPLSGLIMLGLQILLGLPLENPQLPFLAPEGFSWFGLASMFLLGGVVVPFAEELYFRGVLYRWLHGRWGLWPGALVSSLVFGAVHGDVPIAGAAFSLGVVLAWIYERSQSLWPAVLIHITNNVIKILALYIFLAFGLFE